VTGKIAPSVRASNRNGLFDLIGADSIFATEGLAIGTIYGRLGVDAKDDPFQALAAAK